MKLAFSIVDIGKNLKLRNTVEKLMKKNNVPFTCNNREENEEIVFIDYYVNDKDLDAAMDYIHLAKQTLILRSN